MYGGSFQGKVQSREGQIMNLEGIDRENGVKESEEGRDRILKIVF